MALFLVQKAEGNGKKKEKKIGKAQSEKKGQVRTRNNSKNGSWAWWNQFEVGLDDPGGFFQR